MTKNETHKEKMERKKRERKNRASINTTTTTEPKKMKSVWYEKMKETHDEEYIGAFDNLRNNDWITATGCPLSNKQLKIVETDVKKGQVFRSNGTFGTQSVFCFDENISKFVGYIFRPKMLGETGMKMEYL